MGSVRLLWAAVTGVVMAILFAFVVDDFDVAISALAVFGIRASEFDLCL